MKNKDSYYLLDNEVRYYPATQRIVHPESEVQLTDFQHKLLMYFLEHPNDVYSRTQISEQVWPKKVTTVDAFNKPLGAIRNGLSNNLRAKKNHYIKTWAREGYSLVCNCQFIQAPPHSGNTSKWLKRSAVPIVVSIALVWLLNIERQPVYEAVNLLRLTPLQGIAAEPSLSDDGQQIAFTFYDITGKGQIMAKKISARDHIELTQGHNDKMPALSPNADRLLYQRLEDKQCQIRMMTFSQPLKVQSDELLIHCNPSSYFVSMSWHDENAFYYTDASRSLGPYSIYRFDLKSGLSTLYLSPEVTIDKQHNGFARVVYHRKTDKLYIIHSPDWQNSQVLQYHAGKLKVLTDIDAPIGSVGIFNDSFIFKDNYNRLMLEGQKQPLTSEFDRPVLHPVTSQDSNKIAYYFGHVYEWNIFSYALSDGKIQQLTFKNASNRYPIKTVDNFYYASDFTGITQIYRQPQDGSAQPVPLTNFKKNRRITHIAISPDNKILAISYVDHSELFAIIDDTLNPIGSYADLIYPSFSPDSHRVLFSKVGEDGIYSVIEYSLTNDQPTGISIADARFAIYHPNSGIIYAKTAKTGLYLYVNGTSQTINDNIEVFKPSHISLAGQDLYSLDKSNKSDTRVRKITLSNNQVTLQPIYNAGHLFYYNNTLYYTLEQLGESSIYVGDIIAR